MSVVDSGSESFSVITHAQPEKVSPPQSSRLQDGYASTSELYPFANLLTTP